VAPAFDHTPDNESALSKEILADRSKPDTDGKYRTITAIHIDDLARLVQLRQAKRLGLGKIRELFQKCNLPEQCKAWIDDIEKQTAIRADSGERYSLCHHAKANSVGILSATGCQVSCFIKAHFERLACVGKKERMDQDR